MGVKKPPGGGLDEHLLGLGIHLVANRRAVRRHCRPRGDHV